MIRIFFLFFTLVSLSLLPAPGLGTGRTVEIEVIHSQDHYPAGGSYPLLFKLRIAEGWYIHGPEDDRAGLIPTRMTFEPTAGASISGISFPEVTAKQFVFAPRPVEVYEKEIFIKAELGLADELLTGQLYLNGHLSYQACNYNSCLPPETVDFAIPLTVVSPGTPVALLNREWFSSSLEVRPGQEAQAGKDQKSRLARAGFWAALFIFFSVGLGLNLTPCVYPLIPITVSYFSGRRQGRWGERILHGSLYILGISITNATLGVMAALTGGLMGALLQNPLILIFIAGVMIALALNFFGFWELRLPSVLTRAASKSRGGLAGTLFMGLTLGILAAPCLGPAILGLLTFVAQRGDPFFGFITFFVMSVGLGLPLATLGVFSGAVDKLPLSGDWMVWVRKLMGWVLIGAGAYYLSLLWPGTSSKMILIGLILVMAALHLGWGDKSGVGLPQFLAFKKTLGFLLVLTGIGFFYYAVHYPKTPPEEAGWVAFEDRLISQAVEENKPLLIDFYADWCNPCKIMEQKVFQSGEFRHLSQGFIIAKVDLTRQGRRQTELAERFRIRGVPTVIFYDRRGQEIRELRLEGYEGKNEFLRRMESALDR